MDPRRARARAAISAKVPIPVGSASQGLCRLLSVSPEDALDYLLEAAIDRFGYSARDVFDAVFNHKDTTRCHQGAFRIKYAASQAAVSTLPNNRGADYNISHQILALSPFVRVGWTVDFKSDWVARNVIRELDKAEDIPICQQISYFRRIPEAQAIAGRLLGPLAHRSITETSTGGFWPLIEVASNDADPPQFAVALGASSRVPDDVQFAKVKRKIVKFQSIDDLSTFLSNAYYAPEDLNFPLFDAFTIDFDRSKKSTVLWVLQITTSRLHGASAMGYQKIIASLKDQLEEDPPPKKAAKVTAGQSTSKPLVQVRYLLVAPKGDSQNLRWNFPNGWTKNWMSNDHRGDVYCLEVPLTVLPLSRIY